MRTETINPQFVEFIPKLLEPGILYISKKYKTASHLCACGCGEKVVTPLSPVDWQLRNESGLVSLHPSIGNWSYACRSHYWIHRNCIAWSDTLTEKQIARIQARDRADKARYITMINKEKDDVIRENNQRKKRTNSIIGQLWKTLRRWFGA